MFDKVNGFIRVYNGIRYLILFGPEKDDAIHNRIRYLISAKSGITYVISYNYVRIKVDSYNSLPLEKTLLTFHFVMILITSIFNKDKNNIYYDIFLKNVHINNIKLTFLKELMLIKQVHRKSVTFATLGIFLIKDLSFNQMFVMIN